MSLDAPKSDAELLALLEQRSGGARPAVALGPKSPLRSGPKNDYSSRRRPKAIEHEQQRALFAWVDDERTIRQYPELGLYHATPNGGHRSPAVAAKLKAEGVRAGVLDTCLPIARGNYIGLWIELKSPSGAVSPAQRDWISSLAKHGHRVVICTSWEAARDELLAYLSL